MSCLKPKLEIIFTRTTRVLMFVKFKVINSKTIANKIN